MEDVGHILKIECVAIEGSTGRPAATAHQRQTSRVIPAPSPISRQLMSLNSYRADILCLQEVQSDHDEDFYAPELEKHAYTGVYKKTGEIYTGSVYVIDGCATFFRRDRFSLVKKYEVEFNKAVQSLSEALIPTNTKAALSRLLKDNVALIVVLEARDTGGFMDTQAASGKRGQLLCVPLTFPGLAGFLGRQTRTFMRTRNSRMYSSGRYTLVKGLEKIAASADASGWRFQLGSWQVGAPKVVDNKELLHSLLVSDQYGFASDSNWSAEKFADVAKLQRLVVPLEDVDSQNLLDNLQDCVEFIEKRRNRGGVLVHCVAGVSCSAAVVTAYLMHKEHLSAAGPHLSSSVLHSWQFSRTWKTRLIETALSIRSSKSELLGILLRKEK